MANWVGKVLGGIFGGGGGTVKAIENIALEMIETDMESAEAQSVRIKALDPNGAMRREIMQFVTQAYKFYLILSAFLILTGTFGLLDTEATKLAFGLITDTFLPVTGLFGTLATASFGVSHSNNWKEVQHGKGDSVAA